VTRTAVRFVDVYVLRPGATGEYEALVLRRAAGGRCPGSWEAVHGRIEPGETPAEAALRELREETGLAPVRFYNLSRVETFYLHRTDEIALIPVFAAIVAEGAEAVPGEEHDAAAWLAVPEATARFAWPRERRALGDAVALLAAGDAGAVEDVLRVC